MTIPKKIIGGVALTIAMVAMIPISIIYSINYQKIYGPAKFYVKWRKEFSSITKPEQDKEFAVQINNKEWYTMRLNCVCTSKEEFDALIIKDSKGNIYTYDKHVCGNEGFLAMNLTNVSNLKEFENNLLHAGFKPDL
jgi:hypothetical protein